jgi:hypothetical protein
MKMNSGFQYFKMHSKFAKEERRWKRTPYKKVKNEENNKKRRIKKEGIN